MVDKHPEPTYVYDIKLVDAKGVLLANAKLRTLKTQEDEDCNDPYASESRLQVLGLIQE